MINENVFISVLLFVSYFTLAFSEEYADPLREEQVQRKCRWGAPAVSACFPASGGRPPHCGRGYSCDTKSNFCCREGPTDGSGSAPPGTIGHPMPHCPDNTPAVSACLFGFCGPQDNLTCTATHLCCPNNPTNTANTSSSTTSTTPHPPSSATTATSSTASGSTPTSIQSTTPSSAAPSASTPSSASSTTPSSPSPSSATTPAPAQETSSTPATSATTPSSTNPTPTTATPSESTTTQTSPDTTAATPTETTAKPSK